MYFLDLGDSINDAFRRLMITLCNAVYQLIVFFSDMFFRLGSAEIFKNETIKEIYARVGLILGLFMIFRVTIVLIQYVLDPDKLLDKQKGLVNIAKKMVIVVVLLGVTPSIFRFAFSMQDEIISSNVIPIVITGKRIKSDDFGHNVAWITFNSFYKFDNEHLSDTQKKSYCSAMVPNSTGSNRTPLESDFLYSGTLRSAYSCVNTRYDSGSNKGEYVIDFSGEGILALVAGLIILWIIIMFTIQVAVRVFQLAYLQLIAPIPIIAYLTPKGDDNFNKWVKQCTSTYIDFFIRVAIIYFVIYIIEFLAGNSNQYFLDSVGANNMGFWDSSWLLVVMIIALLLFAKKVPDLLKEVFPSLGGAGKFSFNLNHKKTFGELAAVPLAGAAIGYAGKKIGQGANYLEKKVTKPITSRYQNWRSDVKNRNEIRDLERPGEKLFERYGTNIEDAFSEEYRNSYLEKKAASKAKKDADDAVTVARSNGDAVALAEAIRVQRAAENRLNDAEKWHENNRKRFGSDARKEDAFKTFKSLHPDKFASNNSSSSAASRPQFTSNRTVLPNGNTMTSSGIEVVDTSDFRGFSNSATNNSNVNNSAANNSTVNNATTNTTTDNRTKILDEHSKLVEKYNAETDPAKKKEILKQIDEFERKH